MLSLPDFKEKQIVFVNQSLNKRIHFTNDNLILKDIETNQIINRVSCYKIFALFLVGDISLTSVFLRKSQRYGFCIIFLTRNFAFYGLLGSQTEGNFLLRSKQYQFPKEFELAKHIVRNKINNQFCLLCKIRNKSSEQISAMEIVARYRDEVSQTEEPKVLLGTEGYAAKVFFKAYFIKANFKSRKPRAKVDELNVLFDIGYTYLFNFVECHLRLYGFDIYKGFYHTCFYERKSLVCDLVEPFRCIIDHAIYRAYQLKQINLDDFGHKNNQYYLQPKKINKYTDIFFKAITVVQDDIFLYMQAYYRSFMKQVDISKYPVFDI